VPAGTLAGVGHSLGEDRQTVLNATHSLMTHLGGEALPLAASAFALTETGLTAVQIREIITNVWDAVTLVSTGHQDSVEQLQTVFNQVMSALRCGFACTTNLHQQPHRDAVQ